MNNQLRHRADLAREKITLLLINESLGSLLKKEFQEYLVGPRLQAHEILSSVALPAQMALDLYQGKFSQPAKALKFNRSALFSCMNKYADKG
ncbi:MAG: hypothetical protein ACN4GM_01140 [Gammaproteobacteria bacterium]